MQLLLNDPAQQQADAITLTQTSTTDVYKFFKGGVSGALALQITITYTDSTKATIQSVTRDKPQG